MVWSVKVEGTQTNKQATSKQTTTTMTHANSVASRVTITATRGGGTHKRWLEETSKIPTVLKQLFAEQNISSKHQLDHWCGDEKRTKLYNYVKYMAPEHWNELKVPESSVRFNYEMILTGFKISRA